jgi:hypothetical protein
MEIQERTPEEKAAIKLAWTTGRLKYLLKPVQKKIYDSIKNSTELIYVVNCSRRLGKSFTLGVILTEIAIKYPGSQLHFSAPFQNQVKKYFLPIFRTILKDCPEELKPVWRPVDGQYVFPNQSAINLCGCNNQQYNNLRGNRSDYFVIDEARDVDELETIIKDVALPQLLSSPYDFARVILPSTPPSTPDHAFKDYSEKAKARGAYSEFTIDESWYSPERIEKFMAEAGGRGSASAQREYYCKFTVDPTLQIIPEWKSEQFVREVPKDEYFQFYTLLEGMDVGYRDFTAWVLGYYDWKNARVVIDYELALRENKFTTQVLADEIKRIEEDDYRKVNKTPRIARISDNNNLNILADLSRIYKMPFAPVSKKNGKEWMVNQLREFIKAGKLIINPRCKMTIASLEFGIWKRDKTDFERSKELGHYDFIDALVYLISVMVPTVANINPVPPLYRLNVSTTMFPNGIPKYGNPNPTDDIVRKMFPNPFPGKK